MPAERISDEELRLECARLAAIFYDKGDLTANAARLYSFIRQQPSDEILNRLRKVGDGSLKAIADAAGVSQAYVCGVLKGQRPPSQRMLDLIGYRRIERRIYEYEAV